MYGVIGTHTHRAKTVCTGPELFNKELPYLREALSKCKYPRWEFGKVQRKLLNNNWKEGNTQEGTQKKGLTALAVTQLEGPPKGQTQHRTHSLLYYNRVNTDRVKTAISN